jgi:hypothetical protein
MIPNELRDNPKLWRLRRMIAGHVIKKRGVTEEAESLMRWIDQAIADWAREERRRRKARKRRG